MDSLSKTMELLSSSMDDEDGGADRPDVQPELEKATHSLPRLMLAEATTPAQRRRMKTATALSVLVTVPTADWVDPIRKHMRWRWNGAEVIGRSEKERGRGSVEATMERFLSVMVEGGRYAAVSQDPGRYLPAGIAASADVRIVITGVSNRVIARAIRLATGRRVPRLPAMIATGLGFSEIAGAIRMGSTPRQCIERLVAATRSRSAESVVGDAPLIEDLHGYGRAKEWAQNLLTDLDAWRAGELKFEDIERNVVLASAPGLGKTTFARSLARSAGLPLIATGVGEWFADSAGHLDSVIKEVDRVFASAVSAAPAILFLDEIDAIPDRRTLDSRGRDWWLPVITHILTKLDGATSPDIGRLIVMGATNHAERLDPALVRPGRLSRVIEIGLPSPADLVGIYRQHLGEDLLDADLRTVADLSRGSTGAEVMGFVRAARRAARQQKRALVLDDLVAIVAPPERRPDDQVWRVAVHEASHAVVAHDQGDTIEGISIVRRGRLAGFALRKITGSTIPSKADLENAVRVDLAGYCGEKLFFGDASAGSGGTDDSDLADATRLVGALHVSLGLGEELLFRAEIDDVSRAVAMDPSLRTRVEADLRRLEKDTMELLRSSRSRVDRLARELVRRRYLDRDRISAILGRGTPASSRAIRSTRGGAGG